MPITVDSDHPPKGNPDALAGDRFHRYWLRHRTLFWTLHSIWALAAGGVVIFLANERYGFVPWVILFLILTWASTFLFSRTIAGVNGSSDKAEPPRLHRHVASYLTRVMYQETLFFILPFYWYSMVARSPNIVFFALLAGLAVLSCVDLVFDRWLQTRPLFGLVYFATVTFSAINLMLPILLPVDPAFGTPLAALAAVGSAIPLAVRGSMTRRSDRIWVGLLAALLLVLAVGLPRLVPPVPLRLKTATFSSDISRATMGPADSLRLKVRSGQLRGAIFIFAEVFAPSSLPTSVSIEWKRDGRRVRTSREIGITAHKQGFRIWDGYRSETGRVPPGKYAVVFRTAGNRVFGVAEINVSAEGVVPLK